MIHNSRNGKASRFIPTQRGIGEQRPLREDENVSHCPVLCILTGNRGPYESQAIVQNGIEQA